MVITLFYTSLLGLLYAVLAARVGSYRTHSGIGFGTGDDPELMLRMRVQANFVEYVPFTLVLMALVESLSASRYGLHAMGATLLIGRVLHAIGLSRGPVPNLPRELGAGLTMLVGVGGSIWGLWLAAKAF